MNRYNIEITKPAENDLREIGLYIVNELLEPDIAIKKIERISDGILKLEEMPFRNTLVKDERLAFQGIHKVIIDNYIIFYNISEELKIVTIIRILHSKRNWIDLL